MKFVLAFPMLAVAMMLFGCEATPGTPEAKQGLHDDAQATLSQMKAKDSDLQRFIDRGVGYVIFPSVGKGGLVVGGAYGRGEVYEGGRMVGYADLQQGSVGLQAGGQEFAELLVFENQDALKNFQSGKFSFSANASAIALKAGASAQARFENGIAVFTMPKGGLMFEASIGGQKFDYVPLNQQGATDTSMERRTETTNNGVRTETEIKTETNR